MFDLNPDKLDRHITGNWGDDQYNDVFTCPSCEGSGMDGDDFCARCGGEGFLFDADLKEEAEEARADQYMDEPPMMEEW